MAKERITMATIRALATAKSFARGEESFRAGCVSQPVRRGADVAAEVEGSDIDPYHVAIRLNHGGVAHARCSCPYEFDGYCKHIVAVLLKLRASPGAIVERPPTLELLAKLDKQALIELVGRRLDRDPDLARWIDAEIATAVEAVKPSGKGGRKRRTLVDPEPIREQAQALVKGRYRKRRYWDDYHSSGDVEELERLAAKATPFLEAGDGRNALRVLQPVAEAFVSGWLAEAYGSHDEHMYLLFDDLGRMIAEAVLMSDLTADERDDLAEEIADWQDRLADYGGDESFTVAIQALQTGWDDPPLKAVLAGKAKSWPPRDRRDEVDARLTAVMLRVLAASDRTEEYLRLSKAARAHATHASMLVKLNRPQEAMDYAARYFKAPSEAHELAKVLREAGDDARALDIAEAGLALVGAAESEEPRAFGALGARGQFALAHWLRDYAGAMGKTRLALTAAIAAFTETCSLEEFRAAEKWAGKSWSRVRRELLARLGAARYAQDRTEIYLQEGLIDEAVRSAGEPSEYGSTDDVLMRLAEAAHASHADWVIRFATRKAADIMDNNRAPDYPYAAQWLEKAALAYEAAGRHEEWTDELDALIEKHQRKYKLKPLLLALR